MTRGNVSSWKSAASKYRNRADQSTSRKSVEQDLMKVRAMTVSEEKRCMERSKGSVSNESQELAGRQSRDLFRVNRDEPRAAQTRVPAYR